MALGRAQQSFLAIPVHIRTGSFCVPMASTSPQATSNILLGTSNYKKLLREKGIALADGNKTRDNTTTVFKAKNKDGKRLVVQFGKSLEDDDWVRTSLVSYVDANDSMGSRRIVFADLEKDKKIEEDLEGIHKEIGKRLFDGREAYWNGRVSDDMKLEEFMGRKSTMVKTNRLTGKKEALLKCRAATKLTPASKFYLVSHLEKDAKLGGFSMTRRPISKVNGSSRQFTAIISCAVGVYIGWDKGPKWGLFFTVTEGNLRPVDPSAGPAASEDTGADLFGAVYTTEEQSPMVLDAEEGDHIQTEEDLAEDEAAAESQTAPRKRARV